MSERYEVCEKCDETGVTRKLNRALRIVNRNLRREREALREHGDQVFLALCETGESVGTAEQAFRELWERGGFVPQEGGPQNYRYIVERCVEALREYNDSRTSLSAVPVEGTP